MNYIIKYEQGRCGVGSFARRSARDPNVSSNKKWTNPVACHRAIRQAKTCIFTPNGKRGKNARGIHKEVVGDDWRIYSRLEFVSHLAHGIAATDIFAVFLLLQFGNCRRNERKRNRCTGKLDATNTRISFSLLWKMNNNNLKHISRCCRRSVGAREVPFVVRCQVGHTHTIVPCIRMSHETAEHSLSQVCEVRVCVCARGTVAPAESCQEKELLNVCETKCDTYPQIKANFFSAVRSFFPLSPAGYECVKRPFACWILMKEKNIWINNLCVFVASKCEMEFTIWARTPDAHHTFRENAMDAHGRRMVVSAVDGIASATIKNELWKMTPNSDTCGSNGHGAHWALGVGRADWITVIHA